MDNVVSRRETFFWRCEMTVRYNESKIAWVNPYTDQQNETGEYQLRPLQVQRLASPFGQRIEVTKGVVWVTIEGDPQDYVLQAGDSLVIRRRGATLAQALTDAAYRFSKN
jgi:hypothetical protein